MLSFGIIGTNWITESFIQAAQATKEWRLNAVYSRNEPTAKTFADKYGVSNTHTSLESIGQDTSISTIYIASPNSLHHEHAKKMLLHGKHVILEKPACSTVQEFDEITKLARERGLYLIEAYRHIQEENFKIVKRQVGQLGQIYGASFVYAQYSSRYDNVLKGEIPNIFSLKYSGGTLVDLGVYPIMSAVALFGKPKSQTYHALMIRTGVDGGGPITLQYDAFAVNLLTSKIFTSTVPSEIYGVNGTIIMNGVTDIDTIALLNPKEKSKTNLAEKKKELNMFEEAKEFARIINDNDKKGATELEYLSRIVLEITTDLRRQNNIVYECEQ